MPNCKELERNKRYIELLNFCRHYPDWKEELKYRKDTLKSKRLTGMPIRTGIGNVTEDLVVKREELKEKVVMIEKSAIQADKSLCLYIIQSVCYEIPFSYIKAVFHISCEDKDFYEARRRFFCLLDEYAKNY